MHDTMLQCSYRLGVARQSNRHINNLDKHIYPLTPLLCRKLTHAYVSVWSKATAVLEAVRTVARASGSDTCKLALYGTRLCRVVRSKHTRK